MALVSRSIPDGFNAFWKSSLVGRNYGWPVFGRADAFWLSVHRFAVSLQEVLSREGHPSKDLQKPKDKKQPRIEKSV